MLHVDTRSGALKTVDFVESGAQENRARHGGRRFGGLAHLTASEPYSLAIFSGRPEKAAFRCSGFVRVDARTCGFRLEATSTRRTVQDGRDHLPYRNRSCGRPRHCAAPPRYARDVALESERSLHVPLRDEMLSPARSQWPPSASALLSCPGLWATGVPPVSPDGCRNGRRPRTLPR